MRTPRHPLPTDDPLDTCCGITGWTGLAPRFFRALADPNRMAILSRLSQACGAQSVGEVAEGCAVDLSVVSRHLAILRDCGIVSADKRGRTVYYSVRYTELVRTLRTLADAIEACCGPETTASCCAPTCVEPAEEKT